MRATRTALVLALLAGAASAHEIRVSATARPDCTDGAPLLIYIVDASADDDCDATGGGTTEAPCLCLDGAYVAMLAAGGGLSSSDIDTSAELRAILTDETGTGALVFGFTSALANDIGCSGGQSVRRNAGNTAWECYTPSGAGIILDLGDDGGNDSTALAEIATDGDTYGVVTKPSADKALIDFDRLPTYGEQDFDRPPSSCFLCDEFTDGAAALTYAWGNQDSATVTLESDGLVLNGVGTNELHAYCIDIGVHSMPTDADQVFCGKVSGAIDAPVENCMLAVVEAGTIASPTEVSIWGPQVGSSASGFVGAGYTAWTLTGSASHTSTNFVTSDAVGTVPVWIKMSYNDTTRAVTESFSFDGKRWQQSGVGAATTLSADPVTWCIAARTAAICYWDFIRLRTDAGRETCGE